jgi:ParB-like chromosome segregation protein Spo0J
MQAIVAKISDVKVNPNNPRLIKDDKFAKLVQSIKDLPQMLAIRPIVVNTDMVVLGGNMRLKACKEAGLKEVPIIIADNLTEDQQREFLIKDNVSGGEWDWALLQEWDSEQLSEWGLDVPQFAADVDYSDRNEEIDIDTLDLEMIIKLKYTEEEYNLVRNQLGKIASTPEQAVWKLLGNE